MEKPKETERSQAVQRVFEELAVKLRQVEPKAEFLLLSTIDDGNNTVVFYTTMEAQHAHRVLLQYVLIDKEVLSTVADTCGERFDEVSDCVYVVAASSQKGGAMYVRGNVSPDDLERFCNVIVMMVLSHACGFKPPLDEMH